ncbi:hypothetical protein N7535_006425 [Penicillium sp. DV-2018c]|nr:hypothetical protein N7535_006425 [Penicillium sp. DV-2018c]
MPANADKDNITLRSEVSREGIIAGNMASLEESLRTPVVFRKVAPGRIKLPTDNTAEAEMLADKMNEVVPQTGDEAPPAAGATTSASSTRSENKQAAAASVAVDQNKKSTTTATGIDPRAKPFVPASGDATFDWLLAKLKENPEESVAAVKTEPEDSDFDWDNPRNQPAEEAEPSNNKETASNEEKTSSDKPTRGLTDPKDFMKQVRKLRELKLQASKATPTGPPRRIVFGNLPDWATKSDILQLVHGGAVEHAWEGDGEITVQFVNQEACIAYYEAHSNGIIFDNAAQQPAISVTMPEDGQSDHPELLERASKGASRVVCLSGLRPGLKGSNGEDILGIVSAPTWEGKDFDHIVIRQGTLGLDVYVFFYDLHVGWDFLHSIQDGDYECVAKFEADPCTSDSYHFVDEPNRMFSAVYAEN